ncbi:carbonic anhydrase 2-like isoform X3 [Pomacea canaliculata]|uniref:carbonic anhydrase 2-like isoform X3 n=1 Tax=Pomacea canaliculata TaxID=400727 RepID=UPI000D72DD8D|nr:carbonic anhydrase 2-like isoform X3 [Pomacea canaliculata]
MEMHIVTWNTAYGTMENAMTHPDGLAVLAFLFEVAGYDNPVFTRLTKTLNGIQNPDDEEDVQVFPLINLIQHNHKYYRYQGGLTTPPCSEVVQWTIFRDTIHISKSQMSAFRKLKSPGINGTSQPLVNNFRPVQPINYRKVQASFLPL